MTSFRKVKESIQSVTFVIVTIQSVTFVIVTIQSVTFVIVTIQSVTYATSQTMKMLINIRGIWSKVRLN